MQSVDYFPSPISSPPPYHDFFICVLPKRGFAMDESGTLWTTSMRAVKAQGESAK